MIKLRESPEYLREYGEIWHALGEEFQEACREGARVRGRDWGVIAWRLAILVALRRRVAVAHRHQGHLARRPGSTGSTRSSSAGRR